MSLSIDKIISSDDVQIDVPAVLKLLEQKSELWFFVNNKPQFVIVRPTVSIEDTISPATSVSSEDSNPEGSSMKIGKFVQETFRKLLYENILPLEELQLLTSPEYSKKTFNADFPVLKEYNPLQTMDNQKCDDNGHNRYYNYLLTTHSKQYLLSSQWFKRQRSEFEQWLNRWIKTDRANSSISSI